MDMNRQSGRESDGDALDPPLTVFIRALQESHMTLSQLSHLQLASAGILAPGTWLRWRASAWATILFAFAALVFVASLRLPDWLSMSAEFGYWIGIVLPLIGLAIYSKVVRLCEQRNANEIALRNAPQNLLFGASAGFAFMALSLLLLWLCGLNNVSRGHWHGAFHYFVFNAYISGVVEELGFRAILLRIFARMFGPLPGLLISAVLFATAHASHATPLALALLVINGGLLLGVLFLVSGSLWLPIAAHIAYDFTEWSLFGIGDTDGFLIVTPSNYHPDWLTGGATGPDGSVLSALISVALITTVIYIKRLWLSKHLQP